MSVEGDNPVESGTAQSEPVRAARDVFMEMETGKPASPEPEKEDEEEDPNADPQGEPEAEDDQTEGEEPEGEDESEAPDEEEEAPEAEAKEPEAIEIDGKPIPLSEVKDGYLRQQDYTRKTQALAEEKREFSQAIERVTSVDRDARQALEFAASVVKAVLPPPPDPSMIQTDPVSYMTMKEQREQAVQVLRELENQQSKSTERETTQSREEIAKARAAELQALAEKAPAFATDEGRKKFREEAINIGAKHYGLTAEEIDSIGSAKELLVLQDAIAWRKLQSSKMQAVAQAKKAPKIVAKPGTRETAKPANALSALKKLGHAPRPRDIFMLED